MGRRPDGLTNPYSISAKANPPDCPGYPAHITALAIAYIGMYDS